MVNIRIGFVYHSLMLLKLLFNVIKKLLGQPIPLLRINWTWNFKLTKYVLCSHFIQEIFIIYWISAFFFDRIYISPIFPRVIIFDDTYFLANFQFSLNFQQQLRTTSYNFHIFV